MSNKARARQRVTGEKYMGALRHIRGECTRCLVEPCDGCLKHEPCWTCRPTCLGSSREAFEAGRCKFDDLQPSGAKKCVNCSNLWPPT